MEGNGVELQDMADHQSVSTGSSQSVRTARERPSTSTQGSSHEVPDTTPPQQRPPHPGTSLAGSIISTLWNPSERTRASIFGSVKRDLIALATLVAAIYFGWESIVFARRGALFAEIQACLSGSGSQDVSQSNRCQTLLADWNSAHQHNRRFLSNQSASNHWLQTSSLLPDTYALAAWHAFKIVVTFGLGVITSTYFIPHRQPFKPLVSPAREGVSIPDRNVSALGLCERCGGPSKTAVADTQSVDSVSEDERFHAWMRCTIMSRNITATSEDFLRLVEVKFTYLFIEKVRQVQEHTSPKLDATLERLRKTCIERIENSAELYKEEGSLSRTLMEVLSSSSGDLNELITADGDWMPKKLRRALRMLQPLASHLDSSNNSSDIDSDADGSDMNVRSSRQSSSGQRASTLNKKYCADCADIRNKHFNKEDYDLANVTKTKSISPRSISPLPRQEEPASRSRSPSPSPSLRSRHSTHLQPNDRPLLASECRPSMAEAESHVPSVSSAA